jgi:hypothetical protein
MQTKIYETDRVVVELRSTVGEECRYPLSAENQIWLVREAEGPTGVPVWKDINKIQWPYCHMSALCGEQVIQAEFQDRYVDSKPIVIRDVICE